MKTIDIICVPYLIKFQWQRKLYMELINFLSLTSEELMNNSTKQKLFLLCPNVNLEKRCITSSKIY